MKENNKIRITKLMTLSHLFNNSDKKNNKILRRPVMLYQFNNNDYYNYYNSLSNNEPKIIPSNIILEDVGNIRHFSPILRE